jgi:RNA polymerase sigma factor (sigma-70 family)
VCSRRVIYQNWLVEISADPAQTERQSNGDEVRSISLDEPTTALIGDDAAVESSQENERAQSIIRAVRKALRSLSEPEREFIMQFYFSGKTYRQISDQTGRAIHRLEALHKRAVRKLRKALDAFVRDRLGIKTDSPTDCPICRSPYLAQIDLLIAERDCTETWKPIIKTLREKYQLQIRSPQVLIGHEKYHM